MLRCLVIQRTRGCRVDFAPWAILRKVFTLPRIWPGDCGARLRKSYRRWSNGAERRDPGDPLWNLLYKNVQAAVLCADSSEN